MKEFYENINNQIEFNKGKNLFSSREIELPLKFLDETIKALNNLKDLSNDNTAMLSHAMHSHVSENSIIHQNPFDIAMPGIPGPSV